MQAVRIAELTGPDALELIELPDPSAEHLLTPGEGVVIDVRAAAVSFPDVLQSRGLYQFKPELPFVPGAEVAGVVIEASPGSGVTAGDRVAAMTMIGGMAERAVAAPALTFALPEQLDFAQGAALILNYHTAYFALKLRGHVREGEQVLVHGAAGGVGTATLQVAKGLGARTVAVVSTEEKDHVAREAGADVVVRSDDAWREQVQALTDGGVDVVIDPVGGDRFLDSLRALREDGRLVVVGFTGGAIPEVKVNRLLLRNTSVVGAGWGAYVLSKPHLSREIGAEIDRLVASGVVRPIVGARFPLARAADAMRLIDERGALGKVVLELG
ncbi:MAG: NADPH:quinone oxidoreductase family protein [Solirubrobacteraceae bacterium]|nr:MAG: alcohol dehydrogenase [Solirubrobacterales bacterium]